MGNTITLLNINISIKIDNAKRVAEFIKQQDPEIVTIQEITRHFDESVFKEYRDKEIFDEILGNTYPHSFFGPLWITDAFRKFICT